MIKSTVNNSFVILSHKDILNKIKEWNKIIDMLFNQNKRFTHTHTKHLLYMKYDYNTYSIINYIKRIINWTNEDIRLIFFWLPTKYNIELLEEAFKKIITSKNLKTSTVIDVLENPELLNIWLDKFLDIIITNIILYIIRKQYKLINNKYIIPNYNIKVDIEDLNIFYYRFEMNKKEKKYNFIEINNINQTVKFKINEIYNLINKKYWIHNLYVFKSNNDEILKEYLNKEKIWSHTDTINKKIKENEQILIDIYNNSPLTNEKLEQILNFNE